MDKKRIPGHYFLTGSVAFSHRLGIRESLTGRMGVLSLYPLTLAESLGKSFRLVKWGKIDKPRFEIRDFAAAMVSGGMPVPMFFRDPIQRNTYWAGWLETTLYRDLPRVFKGRFQPEIAHLILREFGKLLREGELPTTGHFKLDIRVLRKYLQAMGDIFLLRRIPCHPLGIGKDVYLFSDSGLAGHIMENIQGEGATLSLARHYLLNEILVSLSMGENPQTVCYFKSAKGSPIDFVWGDYPMKLILRSELKSLGWIERSLLGAIKALQAKKGYLVAPVDSMTEVKEGVGVLPWTAWS